MSEFRLNLHYKHKFEETYSEEQIKARFKEGWHPLLDKSFEMVRLVDGADIGGARRFFGLLRVFVTAPTELKLDAAEGIAWKIERLSAKVCEGCGNHGKRRNELKYIYTFCNDCYLHFLNEVDDPMSLFKEGREGRFSTKKDNN